MENSIWRKKLCLLNTSDQTIRSCVWMRGVWTPAGQSDTEKLDRWRHMSLVSPLVLFNLTTCEAAAAAAVI